MPFWRGLREQCFGTRKKAAHKEKWRSVDPESVKLPWARFQSCILALLHLLLIIQAKNIFIFAKCRINKANIHSITPRSTSLTPRNIQERNLHVYKRSIVSTNKQEHLSTIKDAKWTFKHAQLTISNTKRKSLTSSDNRK